MHNPLRSEAEMFRLVVMIGLAAVPVIVIGLAAGPEWGAIVLGVELGIGLGLIWRGSRGSLPREALVAHADDDVHRILVVANETVGGRRLLECIERKSEGVAEKVLVVCPALNSPLRHWVSDEDEARAAAQRRLDASIASLRASGVDATGEIGDGDPLQAIEDAIRTFDPDEVIVSTHPEGRSHWLERGVVDRARSRFHVPLTHVVVDLSAEAAPSER